MEEKGDYNPEEEVVTGNWNTPKVSLKEVDVKTGEEDETLFWSGRSKLYRWVNGEWKERGLGESKLLKHKEKGTIRFLLRQEKTLKIVANHFIYPTESYCKLVPNAGSEKIYAWTVKDFAEEPRIEQFALKFNTPEAAKTFKQKFDEAGENNKKLMNLVDEKGEAKDDVVKGKEKKTENENDNEKEKEKEKGKEKDTEKDKDKNKDTDKEKVKETEKTIDKKEEGEKKDQDKDKDTKAENNTKKITEKENEEKRVEETKENKKEKAEEEKTEKCSVGEKNQMKGVEESNLNVVEKEKEKEKEKKHVEPQMEESKKVEKKEEQNSKDEKKNTEKSEEEGDNLKREDN